MQSRGIMMPNSIIIWFNRNGICRTKQNQVANCQDAVYSLAGNLFESTYCVYFSYILIFYITLFTGITAHIKPNSMRTFLQIPIFLNTQNGDLGYEL